MEDPEQRLTYAAEDMVTSWLDSVAPETGEVRVVLRDGAHARTVTYRPEPEPRFSRPAEVAVFVTEVLTRLRQQAGGFGSNYRGREQADVRVVSHRGWKKATYGDGVIRLPERERGGAWALRGLVVLHELAHHLNTGTHGAIIDAHGAGFRQTFVQLLKDIGWVQVASMLSDAHQQSGLDSLRPVDDGMLAKVGKLLRHAEGASTEAERDAFFAKAQELATLNSIELAVARAAHTDGQRQDPTFEPVRLGHRGKPSNVRFISLMLAVAGANDLRCTIRGDNTGVTLYGFPMDIAVTKTLYVTLVLQMVADADAYIRSGAHRPVHGRTARAAFYEGWTKRIGARLRAAQRSAQVASGAVAPAQDFPTPPADASRALALVAKGVEVSGYYERMSREHGVRGSWRGATEVLDPYSEMQGRAAADRARLGAERELPAQFSEP
ncbi:DUF2786 domain-containing protein [Tessaracoccus rhinocerotis]|uniref:DUF2786 domain-containing protein n=1 Tax=Tessaracoccus rhinocerotis TaxID=1689449 RepID=A0A553K5T7_9ACTN|nr:DUF2786 domain-containing protein [Tessaracoccus rhinocerotis]TRY20079.1 DUF2786 domain-containing protein [Tessaracoccus rhinocerotis]